MAAKKQVTEESTPVPSAALNRKYRPQSFSSDELVGQDHIVRTLRNAIRMDRVAQAYLFCGPRGTGKTSTARILAKAVNCLDPDPDKRPCNECTACVAINSGATPDVIEIDAASNRGIDDIRDLRERVNYAPTQLRTKFYIIDEAHQITGAAANAFLKTLEEPPAHTRFVLATTDPEELLPTIVSRCQRFDFRRHSKDGITQRVRVLAEREGIELTDDALALISDLAHGSMRDPVGLLEQLANYQMESGPGTAIDADAVRELVGITRSELAIGIVLAIAQQDITAALTGVNEAVEAGQDVRQLNRQVAGLIRNALQVSSGLRVPEYADELAEVVKLRSLAELVQIAASFVDTDFQIRSATIPQLPLELAILQSVLPRAAQSIPLADTQQVRQDPPQPIRRPPAERKVETSESTPARNEPPNRAADDTGNGMGSLASMARRAPEARRVQDAEPAPIAVDQKQTPDAPPPPNAVAEPLPSVASTGPLTLELLVEMWSAVRADVKSLDRRIEALMLEIDPVDISGQRVTLVSQYDFHRNMLNDPSRRSIIESVLTRRTGEAYRVEVVLRSEFESVAAPPVQVAAATAVTDDIVPETPVSGDDINSEVGEKFLGAVVRIFDGEIVDEPAGDS